MSLFVPTVSAQTWYNPDFATWEGKVFEEGNEGEIFGERYTYAQVTWIVHSLVKLVVPDPSVECVNTDTFNCLKNVVDLLTSVDTLSPSQAMAIGGPIGGVAYLGDTALTTPPASGLAYTKDIAQQLNLIPESQAQGIGFEGLQSTTAVLELWKAARNIAYFLMVIATLAIAFMIMFRVKISPQVVITIQSAIPKIAIALLLITFSFAIAGFLLDLSYVLVGFFAMLLKQANIVQAETPEIFNILVNGRGDFGFSGILFNYMLAFMSVALVVFFAGTLFTGFAGGVIGGVVLSIPFLIMAVALFIIVIRIVWILLKTWVTILLQIIAAPFLILFGVIPGLPGFGGWLKSLIANLVVFPLTGLILLLANVFFWSSLPDNINTLTQISKLNYFLIETGKFTTEALPPPGLRFPSTRLGPVGDLSILGLFTSFALLFLVPSAADIVKSLIQGRPFEYGAAIGKPVGLGANVATYPIRKQVSMIMAGKQRAKESEYGEKGVIASLKELAGKK